MSSFQGSGGPPPKKAREEEDAGGGRKSNLKPFHFRYQETVASGQKRTLIPFVLGRPETVKVLVLDEAPVPKDGDEWQSSITIHDQFRYGGKGWNWCVCRKKEAGGCLLDRALQERHSHAHWCKVPSDEANPQEGECTRLNKMQDRGGSWRWPFTIIKLAPYTPLNGPQKGVVIPYQRMFALASEDQFETLLTYRKAWGGLRGRIFEVSRGDGQRTPRIGGKWDPVPDGLLTDEQMMEKFKDVAATYGCAPEDYIKPIDYSTIFKMPSADEVAVISKWVAGERGVNLVSGGDDNPVAAAVGAEPEGDESTDVPF